MAQQNIAALAVGMLLGILAAGPAQAQSEKPVKVGFMLPYTGTFAALGQAIENGFRQHVAELGGKLGGRAIEFVRVDDESDPAKAADNANKLIKRDQVDVIVGTVHSGVAMALAKVAKDNNTLLVIPNAGADAITGPLCAPNIFRTSFSNWQTGYAVGKAIQGKHKSAVTLTWKYAAGDESTRGFKEAFAAGGGKILKELNLPFPTAEFQALLTEIAAIKPEAVYVFFAGAGAVKFVKDWQAAGLKDKIPLYASGFLTEGTLEAQGEAATGLITVSHYADDLINARDKEFRARYTQVYKSAPDLYAVQGFDSAQLLHQGLSAVKGDITNRAALVKAMAASRIDSPRGVFTLSRAHNPVQDFYLRKVEGKRNKVVSVAVKALADPARGCKL